jgi:hypothetical protein
MTYNWWFSSYGLEVIFLIPILAILVTLHLILIYYSKDKGPKKYYSFSFLLGAYILLSMGFIGLKIVKDFPGVLLSAEYYNEEGFDIFLRRDGSVKAIERHLLHDKELYGKYKLVSDSIFLYDIDIAYGSIKVNDTLIYSGRGIIFKLDGMRRGISGGTMSVSRDYTQ